MYNVKSVGSDLREKLRSKSKNDRLWDHLFILLIFSVVATA